MKSKILGAILPFMFLTGCWDRTEVNDVAFVMGTAIDKGGDKYLATIQMALPGQMGGAGSQGGGGGTSGGKKWYNQSISGETFRAAVMDAQHSNSRIIEFSHRRTVLFGEELAKEGLEPIIDVLARIPQNRLSAFVLITKGPAQKLLNIDAPVEQNPSEFLRELATEAMKTPRTLKDLVDLMLSEGIDPSVPAVEVNQSMLGGEKEAKTLAKVSGLAVFRENRLAGFLKAEEATAVLIAMDQAKAPEFVSAPPEGRGKINVRFQQYETKLRPHIEGDNATMRIEIRLTGFVVDNESNYDLHYDDNISKFEQTAGETIKTEMEKGISRLQNVFHSDPIGFGQALRIHQPAYWKRVSGNWKDVYPQVKVVVAPYVHIENIGAVMPPLGRREEHLQR